MTQSTFMIFFQHYPHTAQPWRMAETYATSDGPRSRLIGVSFATEDEIRDELAVREGRRPVISKASKPPPGPVNCNFVLQREGKMYPRTCARCGLGPCPFNQSNKIVV